MVYQTIKRCCFFAYQERRNTHRQRIELTATDRASTGSKHGAAVRNIRGVIVDHRHKLENHTDENERKRAQLGRDDRHGDDGRDPYTCGGSANWVKHAFELSTGTKKKQSTTNAQHKPSDVIRGKPIEFIRPQIDGALMSKRPDVSDEEIHASVARKPKIHTVTLKSHDMTKNNANHFIRDDLSSPPHANLSNSAAYDVSSVMPTATDSSFSCSI